MFFVWVYAWLKVKASELCREKVVYQCAEMF